MKTQYKKVVEWEEEPDINNIAISLYLAAASIIAAVIINDRTLTFLSGSIFLCFIYEIIISMGKGRKVYWVKVK